MHPIPNHQSPAFYIFKDNFLKQISSGAHLPYAQLKSSMSDELHALDGPHALCTFPLQPSSVVLLGRRCSPRSLASRFPPRPQPPTEVLLVEDKEVSSNHCALIFFDGLWHVFDLGSTNGTKLRGTRLQPTSGALDMASGAALAHGDTLQCGRSVLQLKLAGSGAAAPGAQGGGAGMKRQREVGDNVNGDRRCASPSARASAASAAAAASPLPRPTMEPAAWLRAVLLTAPPSALGPTPSRDLSACVNHLASHKAAQLLCGPDSVEGPMLQRELLLAADEFAAAQRARQSASLESNTAKAATPAAAATVVASHALALALVEREASCTALSALFLRTVHGTLIGGSCGTSSSSSSSSSSSAIVPSNLRTSRVRVGSTTFAAAACVPGELEALLNLLNGLDARVKRQEASPFTLAAAAAVGVLSLHPFSDGNGRLSRLLVNWALRRHGLPFDLALCATPSARARYIAALRAARAELARGGGLAPFADLLVGHAARAWEELDRLSSSRSAESSAGAAVAAARKAAREAGCMVCLEDKPNVATLCCGAAVHLNCLSEWLASSPSPTCVQCREALPRPPARSSGSGDGGGGGGGGGGLVLETTTTSNDEASSHRTPDFAEEGGTTEDTTSEDDGEGTTEDTTSSDSGSSPPAASAAPAQGRLMCACRNQAAVGCSNRSCGACCVRNGGLPCSRHSC